MGGFAALLGGLGGAAQQYGQEVRGLLEARRTNLGEFLMNMATQERDPQLRAEYMGHASKVFSGDPMAKVLPGIAKTVQGHAQDNAILAQIFAPRAGQQPQTRPGQALGQVPAQIPEPGTAAQAPTSLVAPAGTAQAGPLPAAPGAPSVSDIAPLVAPQAQIAPATAPQPAQTAAAQATAPMPPAGVSTGPEAQPLESLAYDPWEDMARLTQLESHLTPAMGAAMQAPIQQMVQHVQQLGLARNEMEIKQRALPEMIAPLQQIISDPNVAPMMKVLAQNSIMRLRGWAVTPGATVTPDMMNMSMLRSFRPVKTVINVDKTPVPNLPGMAGELHGNHIFMTDPWDGSIQSYVGGAPEGFKEGMQQGEDGVWRMAAYLPGQGAPPIAQPAITPPSQAKPIQGPTAGGQIQTTTPAEMRAGTGPQLVSPAMAPGWHTVWRSVDTFDDAGNRISKLVPALEYSGKGGISLPAPGTTPGGPAAPAGPGPTPPTPTPGPPPQGPPGGMLNPTGGPKSFAKTLPEQLTAAGQNNLKVIDSVLGQIDRAQELMRKNGLDKQSNRDYWQDYLHYKNSGESRYGGLYTILSFERYRSAASAMQGTGRANEIFQGALDHTPALEPNISPLLHLQIPKFQPDTMAGMYNKLSEMRTMLMDARQKNFEDEKKSGVVNRQYTPTTGGTAATGGPLKVNLSSGKSMTLDGNTITFH